MQFSADDFDHFRAKLEVSDLPTPQSDRSQVARKPWTAGWVNVLSGTVGSVLTEVLLFPLDTVKLLVQTASADEAAGVLATFARTIRMRGVRGLYKGLGGSVLKESVHSFNYWCWHGFFFHNFATADDTSRTPTCSRLLLNLLAKQANWLCTVPFEVVSNVNQLAPGSLGFIATAANLYKQSGIARFYRGLGLSLILAINPAIMNTLITTLLRFAALLRMARGAEYEKARDHGPATVGAATALAKIVATVATYPLIRAKVIQQTAAGRRGELSPLVIWRVILASEGLQGLYRGILAMSYKTVLWNSFMMCFKHALGPRRTITPPPTPPLLDPTRMPPLPLMAREPFPAELVTAEKLDEVIRYLQGESGSPRQRDRVRVMEGRMDQVCRELREIKALLRQLVSESPSR